ncbi:MAG: DUF2802 domain-containing protein [Sulfuritalea sp.]|nr:DUF2802 domain-containing protein [Sulfuritalea sp.]
MIDTSTLGVREIVYLVAVLLVAYATFSLLRLWRLGRKRKKQKFSLYASDKTPWVPGYMAENDPQSSIGHEERQIESPTENPQGLNDTKDFNSEPVFAHELERSKLDIEVQRLRREVEHLRAETNRISGEIRYMRTARNVSPLYSEAMTLAQQDVPAAGIAEQCGISIGEAELVAALARGEPGFEVQRKEEDRDDRFTDSTN